MGGTISMRAMVMTAGVGSRLHPLTIKTPKPLVPVANRPVLYYTLINLAKHGISEIACNLYSHPSLLKSFVGDGKQWGLSIHYSSEKILKGTAGGVKKVESFLKGDTTLVLSGDGLTDINLTDFLAFHKKSKALGSMGLKAIDSRFEYGIALTDEKNRITGFVEKPKWGDIFSSTVNTGIYAFEPALFNAIPKNKSYDFGKQVWPDLLKRKQKLMGYPLERYWCDIGDLQEYRRAQRDMLDRKLSFELPGHEIQPGIWVGEGTKIAPNARLLSPLLIGNNCHIQRDVVLGPYTVIGNQTTIRAGVKLEHCTLWDRVDVGDKTSLFNTIVTHGIRVPQKINLHNGILVD